MPGPFPGMDPFLENHWGDVHTSLTTYARNQLQPQLPAGLRARVEEHVFVEAEGEGALYRPDVAVMERPHSGAAFAAATVSGISEELIVDLAEPVTERSVSIIDQSDGDRLVTSIEFLSPGNKESQQARERFQGKQRDLLSGGVNLIEIDLVRAGGWALCIPEREIPASHRDPYRICVRRAADLTHGICYRTSLQSRLPVIRVPLRPQDSDIRLDIQQLVDDAWRDGGYEDLAYDDELLPTFASSDFEWICERIAAWQTSRQA